MKNKEIKGILLLDEFEKVGSKPEHRMLILSLANEGRVVVTQDKPIALSSIKKTKNNHDKK